MWKSVLTLLCALLLLNERSAGLIVPEELPTILSLIYSNIPPIKKGTDSRLGVGFRLGEHADFQVLLELGPQTETDAIGNADSKRRRDAMLGAAMRGELGPLAQAVAKYQIERKLQRELETIQETRQKLKATNPPVKEDKKTVASEWLTKWSKEMIGSSVDGKSSKNTSIEKKESGTGIVQRIGRPAESTGGKGTMSDLKKLYESRDDRKGEIS